MNLGSKYHGCEISNAPPSNILRVGNHGHDALIHVVFHGQEEGFKISWQQNIEPPPPNILRVGIQYKVCDTETSIV
jgi:hypothetical protein